MKGQIAKDNVAQKIITMFGNDYIGEFDKKHYIWADDGGEKVQISITLTCPKVYRGIEETTSGELNFEDNNNETYHNFQPADITSEENETLTALMEKLGL